MAIRPLKTTPVVMGTCMTHINSFYTVERIESQLYTNFDFRIYIVTEKHIHDGVHKKEVYMNRSLKTGVFGEVYICFFIYSYYAD